MTTQLDQVHRDGHRHVRRTVVLTLCIVAVLGFYLRCATSYDKVLTSSSTPSGFQNLQADAFVHGQLALRVPAPPDLVALPDPHDAVQNLPFRAAGLHDLTYYDGKLYTYFGPAPVVLLDVPYRWVTGEFLSSTLACLIFVALGFLAMVRAFQLTARRFVGSLSLFVEAIAVLALGLAGPMAWIVYVGRGYEVVIACGYFLVGAGLLFLTRALFTASRHPVVDLAVASLCLAATIGARPTVGSCLLLLVFAAAFIWWGPIRRPITRGAALAAIAGPVLAVGAVLAWYNWARFGSVTEFGTTYQMSGETVRLARANELGFVSRGFFEYMLSPPRLEGSFPWFRLRLVSYPVPTEENYLLEPVAGLVPGFPAAWLGLVAFVIAPLRWLKRRAWFALFLLTIVIDGLLVFALDSYRIHGATMRYSLDFAPLLLFASVLGGVAWLERLADRRVARAVAGVAAVIALTWSVFFLVNITSYPCKGLGSC